MAAVLMLATPCGCGGTALVDMSAADALEALAEQTRVALREYDVDVSSADAAREAAVIAAFIERARRDNADGLKMDAHTVQFTEAMARLRADRRTAWRRQTVSEQNVSQIEEVARGLRQIAVQSLSLRDDWARWVTKVSEARRKVSSAPAAAGAPP